MARRALAILAVLAPLAAGHAAGRPVLLRYPTIHGNDVVFVAAGNLWRVARTGGTAVRLTADPGQDIMPRFSPDGQWIAYTASDQGNEDVYVIPAAGGEARRLTYHSDIVPSAPVRWGPDNLVLTWTPDSRNVVFLSRRLAWNASAARAFSVPVSGGMATVLPLDRAGFMSYGPDGHSVALTRTFRDFRTWKRYDGGLAAKVYTYDFETKVLTQLTDWKGTDTSPMWYGGKIYFLSDRDASRRANIWSYDLRTKEVREITHFTDDDIRFPSLGTGGGDDGIVFSLAGRLNVIDLPSEQVHALAARVPDDGTRVMARTVKPFDTVRMVDTAGQTDVAISPNGKRVLFSARGDIFSVPAEHGVVRDLTRSSGADEDHPAWSPDGTLVAYTTDASGEQELAVRPADGTGAERLLTHVTGAFFYTPMFSPDGHTLAVTDGAHRLLTVPVAGGVPRVVATDPFDEIHDQSWSPDSRYLAFSIERANRRHAIHIVELATGRDIAASGPDEDDANPEFSADGKLLFFTSTRHENGVLSDVEFDYAVVRGQGLYVMTLAADTPSPFAPENDEGAPVPPAAVRPPAAPPLSLPPPPGQPAPAHPAPKPVAVRIDADGLAARVVPVPVADGEFTDVFVRGTKLFYRTDAAPMEEGTLPGDGSALHVYDLVARHDAAVLDDVDAVTVSADGTRFAAHHGHSWIVADAHAGDGEHPASPHVLPVSAVRLRVDPAAEWAEMFENSWRLERDLFFSPVHNGVDWQHVHDHYAALEKLAASRDDLNEVIGQMIGELGNSHTYVTGGDDEDETEAAPTPLLGVDWGLDRAAGRYTLARIYAGDDSRNGYRAPLSRPGLGIVPGDRLLAVDGIDVRAPADPYAAFVGLPSPLELTVQTGAGKPRRALVDPVPSELPLREAAWIADRRAEVDRLSNGRIGYVYLSNMEKLGLDQFIRQFYPQLDKEALIVDDRWNGGGNIDQMVLERLRRVLVGMSTNRLGTPMTIPRSVASGPKICLVNFWSASDGDIFPFFFRAYGLGKILGERTWGGVRGIRGPWTLLDGGSVTIPEDALYGLNSQWVMENHGVDPDIVVDDRPDDFEGQHDLQLETAVHLLLQQIGPHPRALPPRPALLPAYPPPG